MEQEEVEPIYSSSRAHFLFANDCFSIWLQTAFPCSTQGSLPVCSQLFLAPILHKLGFSTCATFNVSGTSLSIRRGTSVPSSKCSCVVPSQRNALCNWGIAQLTTEKWLLPDNATCSFLSISFAFVALMQIVNSLLKLVSSLFLFSLTHSFFILQFSYTVHGKYEDFISLYFIHVM